MFRIVSMKKEIDMNKRKIYFSFFMAFLFSFVLVVGHNLVDCGKSKLYDIATTMEIILVIPFFLKTFSIFLSQQFNGICEKSSDSYKRRFFIYWICIFAAWIPMLLAFFPGNFTYDSTVQLGQVLDGAYTSHHPLVSTLFIGGLVKLGYKITKNWNMGVLLHSLVQMLIMSGVFSYVVCFISRRVTKKWIKYGSLAYFMFFPVHAVFAITTTKDVIFSAIVVLCVVELIKSFENEWNLRIGCVLIFLLFLFCIFRNNGKYALIFSIPFIFFCCRQRRKQILVVVITTLLLCSFHNVILEKVGVEKGNIREAYSIPIQQIGRTYNYKFDTLDPEEKQEIELLFLEEGRLKKYEARKADSLKDYFATDRLSKRDLKIYLKWGIQNPVEYIDAFLAMINGYFSFEDVLPDTETYRTYVEIRCAEYQDRTDIHLDSKCQFLYDFWYDYFQNAGWENIPFV